MRFSEIISEDANPKRQAAIAIAMKKAGKKPKDVAEAGMPSSVVKSKQRYAAMSDKDFHTAHKDKSEDDLKAMAWRHGYGKGSTHYVDKHKKGQQGVAEGVAETVSMDQAKKVLGYYGADHFKTTTNELHFYKNGQHMSVDLIFNDDATRSVNLSQLNSATRRLKGQGVAEEWSQKYKSSINCSHPKGFSQKAHCAGKKKHNESIEMEMVCEDCGMCKTHGDHENLDEACWKGYHKEGNKKMFGKTYPNCVKNEGEESTDQVLENLHKWFKEKWVRFGPDGKIRGDCARGSESEGKPKCLPQSKAHSLGKKGRASAASRKRREDPNANRSGKAINVSTKGKGK